MGFCFPSQKTKWATNVETQAPDIARITLSLENDNQKLLFSYARRSPKGSEEAPIYIVQSERTTNSRRKMKRNVFKF